MVLCTQGGRTVTLDLFVDESIAAAKARIERKLRISASRQGGRTLVINNREAQDETALAQYGVRKGDKLFLFKESVTTRAKPSR